MRCLICGENSALFFHARVLQKHDAAFYRCPFCFFIQVENPHWLKEAYGSPISEADTGLVERNVRYARVVLMLRFFLGEKGPVVDFGGGHGLFSKILQDHSVECDWIDSYCKNMFCQGNGYHSGKKYGLVTSFEVAEHQTDPIKYFQELLAMAPLVLFSTELVPDAGSRPGEWDYYSLDQGQHISFFSRKAILKAAENLGVYCYSRKALHLFSKRPINSILFSLASRSSLAKAFFPLY